MTSVALFTTPHGQTVYATHAPQQTHQALFTTPIGQGATQALPSGECSLRDPVQLSRVVKASDFGAEGPRFEPWQQHLVQLS